MDTTAGSDDLLTHIVGDIADALGSRAGESRARGEERARTVAGTILRFQPRDAVEAMIAGHCVIFHELIVDAVQDMARSADGAARRGTRSTIVAMDRAFGANLTRLERYRGRQTKGMADEQPPRDLCETNIADRVERHRPGTFAPDNDPGTRAPAHAETGDPREPGGTGPKQAVQSSEAWLANGAPRPPGLNRQARREFGRQARKRLGTAAGRAGLSAIASGAG